MEKELKNIPELRFPEFIKLGDWEKKKIESIISQESSTMAMNKLELLKEGFPVYGADGLIGYINDFQQEEEYISMVKDGSGVGKLNLCQEHSSILGTLTALKSKDSKRYFLKWIYYLLNTLDFSSYVKGAGIPHIYYSDIKHKCIYIPSFSEQEKIADCLSSLDDYINATQEKIDLLQVYKKGFQQLLFATNQSQCPTCRFSQFKKDGKWKELKLSDTCELIRGPFGGSLKKESFVKEGYAVYEQSHAIYGNMESFRYHISEDKFKELKRFRVHSNDIIMSCSGTMGKFAVIPNNYKEGIINQALLKLSAKKGYDYRFIKQLLELPKYQDEILSGAAGGAIKNIASISQMKKTLIYMPNLEEQIFIAGFFASIDDLLTLAEKKLSKLKEHKKGLMQQLFYK